MIRNEFIFTIIGGVIISVLANIINAYLKEKRALAKEAPTVAEYQGDSDILPMKENARYCLVKRKVIHHEVLASTYVEYKIKVCSDGIKIYQDKAYSHLWIQAEYRKLSIQSFTKQEGITMQNRIIHQNKMEMRQSTDQKHLVLIMEAAFIPDFIEIYVEHNAKKSKRYTCKRDFKGNWKCI
ncbi:hypothetical protein [Listeria seeligeri]|uniref:hypothetical protein n=1 Tax=Listeria seeligeri TaxID=1640 RepID=UPI00188743A9|nr:hypothetical protein [Listeria seeligeri]MBF2356052.1 hypothetical protein [Listeria seeligeri]